MSTFDCGFLGGGSLDCFTALLGSVISTGFSVFLGVDKMYFNIVGAIPALSSIEREKTILQIVFTELHSVVD